MMKQTHTSGDPGRPDYRLYLVTDRSMLPDNMSLIHCVSEAVRGGVTIAQLREKDTPKPEFLRLAMELKSTLRGTGVPLIINDRVDIALECGADGVHLGQSDCSPAEARRTLGPNAIIGLSVESQKQLDDALHEPVDYIALSPIFSTPTKTNTIIEWGLDGIRHASSITRIPIIAIGGLHAANADAIIQAGARGVAVVSAICAAKDPFMASKKIREAIDRQWLDDSNLEDVEMKKSAAKSMVTQDSETSQNPKTSQDSQTEKTLESLGEFGLIRTIRQQFFHTPTAPHSLQPNTSQEPPYLGIGDDCAILPLSETEVRVITTDLLIEHKHFRQDWISAEDLAYKSLAVSLSDISAMGATPEYAFLSIGIPPSTPLHWIETFFRETKTICNTYNVALMGGDTTASDLLVINYTVLGRTFTHQVLRRDGASAGDKLMLLGDPGLSGAGLQLLTQGTNPRTNHPDEQACIQQHHRPQLFTKEAVWLAQSGAVTSMIDLSDGLASDAGHISSESGVSLHIHTENLPVSPALQRICSRFDWDPLPLLLASGEDYGLLFTIRSDRAQALSADFEQRFHRSLVWVGDVLPSTQTQREPEITYLHHGNLLDRNWKGFDHFSAGT